MIHSKNEAHSWVPTPSTSHQNPLLLKIGHIYIYIYLIFYWGGFQSKETSQDPHPQDVSEEEVRGD